MRFLTALLVAYGYGEIQMILLLNNFYGREQR